MNSWTSPVDIRPDHLAIVQGILRVHLPAGFKVWVFGSRANWTTKDSSDLDLAVEGAVRLDHKSMIGLEVAFEESDLPYTVDVVDLKAVSSGFRQIVEDQRLSLPHHDQLGKDEWETASWGDLATLEYGKSLRGYESSEGPYRVYGTNGPIGWCNEPLCFHPSVIIGRKGAYRGVHYSATPFFVIDTAFYLRPKVEIDTRWAYYQLLTQDINGMDSGSAIPSTSREDFYGLPVKVPPLAEQRAIAHVLGTLDDKIELNRRMNRTLEEMARAIFQDWFVDFGPTRAKMEGLDPYLPSELWNLFPDELVDSELGEIPEGWETKPLDEIATFLNGLALQKYPPNEGPSLPVIKIAQLRAGHTKGADSASVDVPSKYHIHDGDVLFSWSGSLELDIWTGGEGALNQHLFKVDSDAYPKWLYYRWVREHLQAFRAIAADKTTTMGHIQRRHLSESHTVLPDSVTLEAMNRHMQPLLDKSTALRIASRTLAWQRETLLPQIMSGNMSINLIGDA